MSEQEVVKLMESSQTEQEWNNNADQVKQACGGYPAFWFKAIILSGLINRVAQRWGDDGKIKISGM